MGKGEAHVDPGGAEMPWSIDSSQGRILGGAVLVALALHVPAPSAAVTRDTGVTVTEIAPRFHLLSEEAANMLLFTGEDASVVAGVQRPGLVAKARSILEALGAPPVQWALLMEDESAPEYGDGGWGRYGATTLAHEMLQLRMSRLVRAKERGRPGPTMQNDLPALSFSAVVQVYPRGEETHFVHERPGYTDADVIVHFEASGIVYLGNAFTTDGYPRIDLARDGDLAGLIETADWFLGTFKHNPGKIEPIVPGRGPVATMVDLAAYRDMLAAVRDRVGKLLDAGASREAVLSARPTSDFDARWGRGPVAPEEFVCMVYESLAKARKKAKKTTPPGPSSTTHKCS